MQQKGCICVFTKPPQAGKVKTRLNPAVGGDGAAELANAFLQDTWATVGGLPWARPVIATTAVSHVFAELGRPDVWLQGEGDLGARLERVLRRALKTSPFAIAIGSDTPGLPRRFLEQAFSALRDADAVIGACEDGGFFLLGLRKCPPGLLAGIPWSQRDTFSHTLAKLKAAGLDVRLLDAWFDVDQPQDLERLRAAITAGEVSAPRTKETLERLAVGKRRPHPVEFSIIIPVLNERECLPRTLAGLRGQDWIDEVIVVDGGSTDGTLEWIRQQCRVKLVASAPGRGIQLNAGAKAARGDTLVFLHADTRLPSNAGECLRSALGSPQVVGGCFCIRFDDGGPRLLSVVAAGINLRTVLTHSATGDQAIFARRSLFQDMGGFREWPLFEDVNFVGRLKRVGKFAVIRSRVTVSARRHVRCGVFRTVMLVYVLRLGFWAGISPFTLAPWYQASNAHLKPPCILRGATERNAITGLKGWR